MTEFLYDKKIKRIPVLIAVTILWLITAFSETAFSQDSQSAGKNAASAGAINITSDKLLISSDSSYAQFIGNVHAVQQDTSIQADKLTVFYKESANQQKDSEESLKKIIASGNVKINFDNRVAVTKEAVYITDTKILTLTGPNTRITSGQDSIAGEKIIYYRQDGRVEVEGRVKAEIYSGENGLN